MHRTDDLGDQVEELMELKKTDLWKQWDTILKHRGINEQVESARIAVCQTGKKVKKVYIGKTERWSMILKYFQDHFNAFLESREERWKKPNYEQVANALNDYLDNRYEDCVLTLADDTIKSDLLKMGAWIRASKALNKMAQSDIAGTSIVWTLYYFGVGESVSAINAVVEEACLLPNFDARTHLSKLKSQVLKSKKAELYYLHPDYNEYLDYCLHTGKRNGIKEDEDAYFRLELMTLDSRANWLRSADTAHKPSLLFQQACQEYHRTHAATIRDSLNYAYCYEEKAYIERYTRYFVLRSSRLTEPANHDSYLLEVVSYVLEAFFWYDEFTEQGILTELLQVLKNQSPIAPPFLELLSDFIKSYPSKELKVRNVGGQKNRWYKTYQALRKLRAEIDATETETKQDVANKLLARAFATNYLAESLHFQCGRRMDNAKTVTSAEALHYYEEALFALDALGEKYGWIRGFFLIELVQLYLYHCSFPEALRECLRAFDSVERYNKKEPEIRAWIFDLLGQIYYALKKIPEAGRAWAVARYYALRFQHDQQAQVIDGEKPLPDSYTEAFLQRLLYSHLSLYHKHYDASRTQDEKNVALAWLMELRRLLSDSPIVLEQILATLNREEGKSTLSQLLIPMEAHLKKEALMNYASERTAVMTVDMTALQRDLIQRLSNEVTQYFGSSS